MKDRFKKWFAPQNRRTMRLLLLLLVVLVILDGILTEILLDGGLARESNPLLQPLIGDTAFMVLKVAGALLCALILWDIYRRFPKTAMIAAGSASVLYLGIVLWNASLFFI